MRFYHGSRKVHAGLLDELFSPPPRVIAADIETISLKERIPIGIGIATSPNDAVYFQLLPSADPTIPWHILRDPSIKKVFHNGLNFDLPALYKLGYTVDETNIADTIFMARLLNFPPKLVHFAAYLVDDRYKNIEVSIAEDIMTDFDAKTTLDLPDEVIAEHCCLDAKATYSLYEKFYGEVDTEIFELENSLIPILLNMSRKGLLIDQERRAELERKLQADVDMYRQLAEAEGFNPASPSQVAYILSKRGTLLPMNKKSGNFSTESEVLAKCRDPLAGLVLNFRNVAYNLSHYIKPLADKKRAYTRFHLDAVTGRISSTDRNMQNIPKGDMRSIYLPDSGVFTDMDFSQIELRVLAFMSQDRKMLSILNDPAGDIHQSTADFLGISRHAAKSTNFAMVYGGSDKVISETAGVPIQRANELKTAWFYEYREAGDWIREMQFQAREDFKVKTLYGRTIEVHRIDPKTGIMRKDEDMNRLAVNYPVQASATEIVKRGMLKVKDKDLRLQVHDEYVIDGIEDIPLSLSHIHPELHTPFNVELLERWN